MLRWAVPEFRLPRRILDREIERLARLGVVFKGGSKLGRDMELSDVRRDFHATLMALGCPRHKTLGVPGEELPGVIHALPFLKSIREGRPRRVGSRVVVVGGGDVALDCAQSARRLGAAEVVVVSLEQESDLPAHPNVVAGARAEGVVFRGAWGPQAIVGSNERLEGVQLKKCVSLFDANAKFMPAYDVCQTDFEPADTIIIAIGQQAEPGCIADERICSEQGVDCDRLTLQTKRTDVFVAGDFFSGPSSVVDAMAGGRRAAESIHRYLLGEDLRFGRSYVGPYETDFLIDTSHGNSAARAENPLRSFKGQGDFEELEMPFNAETARQEAGRCYSCGQPFGKYRTCWFCLPCEVECPQKAIWVEIPYLLR
jgi:NADPH-dependent glutamate synthase beta subunit-like oxidoreductase